jgi:hypothetical protein
MFVVSKTREPTSENVNSPYGSLVVLGKDAHENIFRWLSIVDLLRFGSVNTQYKVIILAYGTPLIIKNIAKATLLLDFIPQQVGNRPYARIESLIELAHINRCINQTEKSKKYLAETKELALTLGWDWNHLSQETKVTADICLKILKLESLIEPANAAKTLILFQEKMELFPVCTQKKKYIEFRLAEMELSLGLEGAEDRMQSILEELMNQSPPNEFPYSTPFENLIEFASFAKDIDLELTHKILSLAANIATSKFCNAIVTEESICEIVFDIDAQYSVWENLKNPLQISILFGNMVSQSVLGKSLFSLGNPEQIPEAKNSPAEDIFDLLSYAIANLSHDREEAREAYDKATTLLEALNLEELRADLKHFIILKKFYYQLILLDFVAVENPEKAREKEEEMIQEINQLDFKNFQIIRSIIGQIVRT